MCHCDNIHVYSVVTSRIDHGRDGHDASMAETETLASQDPDEAKTLASPAETRPRQDVQILRRDQDKTFAGLET